MRFAGSGLSGVARLLSLNQSKNKSKPGSCVASSRFNDNCKTQVNEPQRQEGALAAAKVH